MNIHFCSNKNKILNELLEKHNYYCMLTINMRANLKLNESINLLDKVFHEANTKIYGKKYRERNKFIDGYAVVENNNHYIKDKHHFHFLIIDKNNISKVPIDKLLNIFINKSKKLLCSNGLIAFDHKEIKAKDNNDDVVGFYTNCMHITETYNDYAHNYITKTIKNNDVDKLLLLDKSGIIVGDKHMWGYNGF